MSTFGWDGWDEWDEWDEWDDVGKRHSRARARKVTARSTKRPRRHRRDPRLPTTRCDWGSNPLVGTARQAAPTGDDASNDSVAPPSPPSPKKKQRQNLMARGLVRRLVHDGSPWN